jgi:hypothetical protein
VIAGPDGAGKTTFALASLPAVAGCERFGNGGPQPKLVFEQRGTHRIVHHAEHLAHLMKEAGL